MLSYILVIIVFDHLTPIGKDQVFILPKEEGCGICIQTIDNAEFVHFVK